MNTCQFMFLRWVLMILGSGFGFTGDAGFLVGDRETGVISTGTAMTTTSACFTHTQVDVCLGLSFLDVGGPGSGTLL